MSKWVRGIYNTAANFVMSGSLRAASGRTMGGNRELVRQEFNKCDKSNESCESNQSCNAACACHRNRDTACTTGSHCGTNACRHTDNLGLIKRHKYVDITVNRECNTVVDYIERDYNEYTATINSEKQRIGSRVWLSNEPRIIKQTHNGSTDDVEHITGIPTGVTL